MQAISDPPTSRPQGTKFSVTDTTANTGLADAAETRTRYYLSADTVLGTSDHLLAIRITSG